MCGITGAIGKRPIRQLQASVRAMVKCMRHRGPDGDGEAVIVMGDSNVVLGHTRLAIIDLSDRSKQPIHDAASGSWLVYNGEIYNFRELRRELESLGVRFRSSGDAEVLLQAVVRWGEAALDKVQGMFAFGFWDASRQQMLLARDRFGIKPLYYICEPGVFAFGSEVKALKAADLSELVLDEDGVRSFLTFGAVIGPGTMFREVKELTPGDLMWVARDGVIASRRRYWSLLEELAGSEPSDDLEQAVESAHSSMAQAVATHLVSDVPVGIFLSGGVDSSLLSILAARQKDQRLTLLTVGFPNDHLSEVNYADVIARRLELKHAVINLPAEKIHSLLPLALAAVDQPTVDGVNTFVICRQGALMGLRVLLSGLGGDELFGGYTTFAKAPMLLRHQRWLARIATVARKFSAEHAVQWEKVRTAAGIQTLAEAYLMQRSVRWAEFATSDKERMWLPSDFLKQLPGLHDDFQKIAALELTFYMRNQLLRDADVFSMASSAELRVPLLDAHVVRTAFQYSGRCHRGVFGGKRVTKRLLRKLCPEADVRRRKMGFTLPWNEWLKGALRELVSDTVTCKSLYNDLPFDARSGVELLQRFVSGEPTTSWSELWSLFILLNWVERNRTASARVASAD